MRGAAPGLSPISQQTIVSPGANIGAQQSPIQQQPFQDPNAPPQFQRIQIQQAPGQKPMPQGNMVVPVQKPFTENAEVSERGRICVLDRLKKNHLNFQKNHKLSFD